MGAINTGLDFKIHEAQRIQRNKSRGIGEEVDVSPNSDEFSKTSKFDTFEKFQCLGIFLTKTEVEQG